MGTETPPPAVSPISMVRCAVAADATKTTMTTDGSLLACEFALLGSGSSGRTAGTEVEAETMDTLSSMSSSSLPMQRPPSEAIVAIKNTRRWSEDFVRKLGLCPWAGSSLDTIGAIRYWVLLVGCNDDEDDDGDGGNDDGRGEAGLIGSGRGRRQQRRRPATKNERRRCCQRETWSST